MAVYNLGNIRGPIGPDGPTGPEGPKGDKGDEGDKGQTGDKGEQGDKGDKGDQGDAGPVGPQGTAPVLTARGTWNPTAANYTYGDLVQYTDAGFTDTYFYNSTTDGDMTAPLAPGTPWELLINQGTKGDKGDQGDAGPPPDLRPRGLWDPTALDYQLNDIVVFNLAGVTNTYIYTSTTPGSQIAPGVTNSSWTYFIAQGAKGDQGDKGDTGDEGPVGPAGPPPDIQPRGTWDAATIDYAHGDVVVYAYNGFDHSYFYDSQTPGSMIPPDAPGTVWSLFVMQGPEGPEGPQGPKGDKGDPNPNATLLNTVFLTSAAFTTLNIDDESTWPAPNTVNVGDAACLRIFHFDTGSVSKLGAWPSPMAGAVRTIACLEYRRNYTGNLNHIVQTLYANYVGTSYVQQTWKRYRTGTAQSSWSAWVQCEAAVLQNCYYDTGGKVYCNFSRELTGNPTMYVQPGTTSMAGSWAHTAGAVQYVFTPTTASQVLYGDWLVSYLGL